MAAVGAIDSFATSVASTLTPETTPDPAHLPWLLALYDALNDDDDEIRAEAAAAASPLLSNQRLVSVEAGRRLLRWLLACYGTVDEFRAHVACRMAGHLPPPTQDPSNSPVGAAARLLENWIPAEAQLTEAMRFDDSLFVVEEQNLYVDEVRETRRWRDVFSSLPPLPTGSSSSPSAEAMLSHWTLAGLQTLTHIVRVEGRDGPLGWTSKPEVFAICARILISGSALAAAGDLGIKEELRRFRDEGRKAEVHGLLLGMCDGLDD